MGVESTLTGLAEDGAGVPIIKKGLAAFSGEGAPPGVAGPASAGQPVVYDPGTGLYVNQATGAVSTDSAGQHPVQDPSLATQAARNLATSQQFLGQLGQYGQQYNGAQAAENSLAGQLNATIAGTAPSVARAQLEQGLSQIVQQQQSQASGANGQGGALARTNAAANTGNAQAATNAAQAGVRAQEVTGAENTLGSVLGNQANQANSATQIGTQAAENFGGEAGNEQANQAALTQKGNQNQLTTIGSVASAAGEAAGVGSDVQMKEHVKPADMDDFLSKLSAINFDYKDPKESGAAPGRRIGIKAQDAQKSKVGKSIVNDEGEHLKLDGGNTMGAILAALAHLNKKLDARG